MLSEKLYRAENSSRGTAGRVGAVEGTRSGFSEMVWTVGSTTAGAGTEVEPNIKVIISLHLVR